MVLIILGPSGSGKSCLQDEFVKRGFRRIITYTTRSPRSNEKNGSDYHFVRDHVFEQMKNQGAFAEISEYSQGRKYASLKQDYLRDENCVIVLTPDGLRNIQKMFRNQNIRSVLITCSLGGRIVRYVERIGQDKFTFDDKNEICSRVERDFGMFLNVDGEVDYVVENNGDRSISDVADEILKKFDISL